tara:strand:+ start:4677 stop:4976 length:300 start_codon:yes stop_codon:yes gene_type:complete
MKKILKAIGAVVIIGLIIGYFAGGGMEGEVNRQMDKIENQVAQDAVRQFEIAQKNGNDMDAYSAASMVVAAYLQAEDEDNYKKWKKVQDEYGKKLGLNK